MSFFFGVDGRNKRVQHLRYIIFKGDILNKMIRVSEKKPLLCSTIIFDVALLLIFPTFLWLSWPNPTPTSVFIFLIVCHAAIGIMRYGFEREILWPIWADLLAIFSGIILIVSAFIPPPLMYMRVIFVLSGLVLCYGHIRKIVWPDLPYYFSDTLPITKTPSVSLVF